MTDETVKWESSCGHIAERIKDLVRVGQYPPGSRLPPERKLAELLGTNRTSLREALRLLESSGLLDTRRSAGTWVAPNAGDLLAGSMEIAVLLDRAAMADFLEVYELLNVHIAERAALRRTEDDIANLREAVQGLWKHPNVTKEHAKFNVRLQHGIAAAAHSPVSEQLWLNVFNQKRAIDQATGRDPRVDKSLYTNAVTLREQLVEAIARGDISEARRSMAKVVASTEDYWTFIRGQLLAAPPSEDELEGLDVADDADPAVGDTENAQEYAPLT